jgi:threonine aldolase
MPEVVDLRSDTVTRPTAAMRRAMAEAEVGDDVYGDDPTVRRLEAEVAARLGKAAAAFFPSGTMANQAAIRAHTEPGDEVILERYGHSYAYEGGGLAVISGVQARPLTTARGLLDPSAVEQAIQPDDVHFARTRVVVLENTANRGGGTIYPPDLVARFGALTARRGLVLHVDGARLFNAHVASGAPLDALVGPADSVSVCLSKGLGAPVGSVLAGSAAFITRARRVRKLLGGGLRQAGILAAAGLHALEHHVARLADDHRRLRALVDGCVGAPGLEVDADPARYPTNIAYLTTAAPAAAIVGALAEAGVRVNATGPHELRVVTHLDVDDDAVARAVAALRRVAR